MLQMVDWIKACIGNNDVSAMLIIIGREAREIIRLVASVRLCVYALTSEPFDLRHVAVNIWAQLAKCSKSTKTHEILPRSLCVCQ